MIQDEFDKAVSSGSATKFKFKEEICTLDRTFFAEIHITSISGKTLTGDTFPEDIKYKFQLYTSGNKYGFQTKFRLDNHEHKQPHMHISGTELPCYAPLWVLSSMFFSHFPTVSTSNIEEISCEK